MPRPPRRHPALHPHSGPRAAALGLLLLAAGCAESPTAVAPGDASGGSAAHAENSGGAVSIGWPADGSWVVGIQPFEAVLPGRALGSYRMYWQVDGDRLNPMDEGRDDAPHKAASVDVGGWNWRGSGPYVITFVAKDLEGKTIATRSTTIHVGSAPPPAAPAPVAPAPAPTAAGNPFAGARLWVDPNSAARRQVDAWSAARPADAALISRIADRPNTLWLGDWLADVRAAARETTGRITAAGALPVFVLYNIPNRDCGQYSSGGAGGQEAYRSWIRGVADGIGDRRAVVILEPDALGQLADCLSPAERGIRLDLLSEAVRTLKAKRGISVYVDAGNPRWRPAAEMAAHLRAAGIDRADGFSLNVSNYHATEENLAYGAEISSRVGGKHFVVDTSRNGLGAASGSEWCNPAGRALGRPPTTETGHPLVDAFLWVKRPGESDGECNGGPAAGAWWAEHALGLARRMPGTLAMLP